MITILLIEDCEIDYQLWKRKVSNYSNVDITWVTNAKDAIVQLQSKKDFTAIISDLNLNGMIYTEILEIIRMFKHDSLFFAVSGISDILKDWDKEIKIYEKSEQNILHILDVITKPKS